MTEHINYWLDLYEYSHRGIPLDIYLLKFINPVYVGKIPSAKFWGITLMIVKSGAKINCNGHILTIKDCFDEMEDCWRNESDL